MPDERRAVVTADLFKALAHPARVAICEFLRQGEQCVCEIVPALQLEQSTVSKHLAVLRRQGLVKYRKEGLKALYRLCCPEVGVLLDDAQALLAGRWEEERDLWQ